MLEIVFDPAFERAYKKRIHHPKLKEKFWRKVEIFINDPYHSLLKTHKLSGKLKDLLSFSIDYDCRIIFYFKTSNKVVFIDIGSHDEVY